MKYFGLMTKNFRLKMAGLEDIPIADSVREEEIGFGWYFRKVPVVILWEGERHFDYPHWPKYLYLPLCEVPWE